MRMTKLWMTGIFAIVLIACQQTPVIEKSVETVKKPTPTVEAVKAGKFDAGKMWTFDFPPTEWFKEAYDFAPDQAWYDHVRQSALRFASYCTASFVSPNGLVMTNHHCARQSITEVTQSGEDLHKDGFYAKSLTEERKVTGLYVDQLQLIRDVTKEIQDAIDAGKNDEEKTKNKLDKMKEIEGRVKTETGLEIQIVTFYNGGRYSLYGFKRFKDVRAVFAPETQLGYYGGDPDNFTYPRYNLDASFFRVYDDNGNPLKSEHYYPFSVNGAEVGEPVFVVGNPGRTNRLNTVAQLEFQRDYQYPYTVKFLKALVDAYTNVLAKYPERELELTDRLFGFSNSLKAYQGMLGGLQNPTLMAKKVDWETSFRSKVLNNSKTALEYGNLWNQIAGTRSEVALLFNEATAYNQNPGTNAYHFFIARRLVEYANEMKKPEAERSENYKGEKLIATKNALYPAKTDDGLHAELLEINLELLTYLLGSNHPSIQVLTGGKSGKDAVSYLLSKTIVTSKDKVLALADQSPEAILNSTDPFIQFAVIAVPKAKELGDKIRAITVKENDYVQKLGRAVYDAFGTSIPPDATFSLRIADGVVKGYEYNGTTAPPFTTFYGLYDRWHSFNKEFPWNLPANWENPPREMNLHTRYNFVSTNDIIGGNSGSAVINKKGEVVGLAFDGNIESLPGQFIFDDTYNRTVSVHSSGMLEAIQHIYKMKRLSDELKTGKLSN